MFNNAVIFNNASTCKQFFTCNGYFPILYWRLKDLRQSILKIHSIFAGATIETNHQFTSENFKVENWHQSKSPDILIDFISTNSSSSFSLEVECRNIEVLNDFNALVLFQRILLIFIEVLIT